MISARLANLQEIGPEPNYKTPQMGPEPDLTTYIFYVSEAHSCKPWDQGMPDVDQCRALVMPRLCHLS